jgi:hypothetical protein
MIKNGTASYTNQFIPSPRFSIERELGEEYFPTIGEYKGMVGLMKLTFHSQLVKEKIDDLLTVSYNETKLPVHTFIRCDSVDPLTFVERSISYMHGTFRWRRQTQMS